MNKLKDYKLKFSGFSIIIIYVLSLKQKIFITKKKKKKKIITITSKSLQWFMQSVAIQFEVIGLCYKKYLLQ